MSDVHHQQLVELQRIAQLLDAQSRRVVPDLQTWPFNVNSGGFNLLLEGQQGQRIFVAGFVLSAAGAVTATFGATDGVKFVAFSGKASTGNAGDLVLAQGTPAAYAVEVPHYIFRTEQGAGLAMNLSSGVAVGGFFSYWKA